MSKTIYKCANADFLFLSSSKHSMDTCIKYEDLRKSGTYLHSESVKVAFLWSHTKF